MDDLLKLRIAINHLIEFDTSLGLGIEKAVFLVNNDQLFSCLMLTFSFFHVLKRSFKVLIPLVKRAPASPYSFDEMSMVWYRILPGRTQIAVTPYSKMSVALFR